MTETFRRLLLGGTYGNVAYAADTGGSGSTGEPLGVIELEGNLADAEKPPELRNGRYRAELQGVDIKTSGTSGNRYFACKFVIPPEELSADIRDDYPEGATMYWNRQLVPDKNDRRTLYNLRKFIESLGLDSNTTSIDPNDWMGTTAKLHVVQEPYQGEMRAQIRAVEAAESDSAPNTSSKRVPDAGRVGARAGAAVAGKGKNAARGGRGR